MKNIFSLKLASFAVLFLQVLIFSNSAQAQQQEQAYTTSYRYDLSSRLTGTISPDPDGSGGLRLLATRNTYNSTTGLLVTIENGELSSWADETKDVGLWNGYGFIVYSKQVMTYDNYGRKATVTSYDKNSAALSLTEYSYDNNSRVLCTALRMNLAATGNACSSSNLSGANPDRISRFTYDDFDQVTTEERAVNTSVQQNYVSNIYQGRYLRYQVDANCNKTELRYDSQGRLSRIVYPAATAALAAGQSCNKPAVPNAFPNAGAVNESDYVEVGYDTGGNKNYERKRNGTTINYTLDNNNRVIFKDYSDNTKQQDITYNYDLRGLQLSAKFGAVGITNTFDGFGNLSYSTNDMTNTFKIGYLYDLNNNRTRIDHPDGAKFTYTFDGLNRMNALVDGSTNTMLNIAYQPNGKRNNISRYNGASTVYRYGNGVQLNSFSQTFSASPTNNLTNSFTYNAASQIDTLTQSNSLYYYQGNDNRTGVYVPDGLNRYKSAGTQSMGYDLNSNLKYDGMTYYNYDDENRLLSMTKLDEPSYNPNIIYDPNGRLYQITFNGKTTKYIYDSSALVLEWSSETSAISRRYVHGDQVDEPLVQFNGKTAATADRIYLHADHQGSIIAQTNSAGAVVGALAYDAYGIPAATNNIGFGYTGQLWLKDLGLDYYKARFYNPKLGRFLQTDPVGYADQMNLYAYCGNDPVNMADSSGEFAHIAIGAIAGGVISGISYAATTNNFSVRDLAINVGVGAVVGGVTAALPGAIAAGSLNFGSTVANIAATVGNATAAGAAGSVVSQAATTGTVDPKAALIAGAANAVGQAAGAAIAPVAKALATTTIAGSAGLPVRSLNGNIFQIGKVEASTVTSEVGQQATQDTVGETVSAVSNECANTSSSGC